MLPKSIYISSAQPAAGSLVVAIGFMEMIKGHYERVAFFRPIIPDGEERDEDIDFMLKHFELDMPYESCCGFKVSEYTKALAELSGEDKNELGGLFAEKKILITRNYLTKTGREAKDFNYNNEIYIERL